MFCYRHKIQYAYNQSRLLKHNLKNDLIEIQKYVQRFAQKNDFSKLSLDQLQEELDKAEIIFSRYGINLTYLNYQTSTLEINLHNYRSRLLAMQKKLEAEKMPSNLENLKEFSRHAKQKYLEQVQKDYENLTPGLKLLEGTVNLIRAEVEVDRSRRDRQFQNLVGTWGIALAVGSTVATLSAEFPTTKESKSALEHPIGSRLHKISGNWGITQPWLGTGIAVIFSLGFTALAWLVAKAVIKCRQRKH